MELRDLKDLYVWVLGVRRNSRSVVKREPFELTPSLLLRSGQREPFELTPSLLFRSCDCACARLRLGGGLLSLETVVETCPESLEAAFDLVSNSCCSEVRMQSTGRPALSEGRSAAANEQMDGFV